MPPDVYWDANNPNVIVLEMIPAITWEEIEQMFTTQKAMAAEKGELVAVIMDVRHSPNPPSADTISRSRGLFIDQPKNVAVWVLVGSNRLGEVMAKVLTTAKIVRMIAAPTMEAAYPLIDKELERVKGGV